MIYSMTGFATAAAELDSGSLTLEIRAVNHRYLDLQWRVPDELRALEPALREAISSRMSRGKVECRVNFTPSPGSHKPLAINETLAQQLVQLGQVVQVLSPSSAPLSVADILRWPGIMEAEGVHQEALQEAAVALLRDALGEFADSRGREGEKLKGMILERATSMEALVAEAAPHLPRLRAAYQEKLTARFREAAASLDDDRIRQEMALFAQKIDIDEEIGRLQTHLGELRRIVKGGGAVGKRLDFLLQELNREANTLGSKSVDAELSQASLDLKVLIEQMREQVQNLE